MGKLRCVTKTGDENTYTLFSTGVNPLKKRHNHEVTRSDLLSISYTPHSIYDGMRSTKVLIPAIDQTTGLPESLQDKTIKELSKIKSP